MTTPKNQYQQHIERLEAEKESLRQTCEDFQNMQTVLEQSLGETNNHLLTAEMSSMELEQVFQAFTDATWIVREDAVVVKANAAMLKMLGKSQEEVVGRHCAELINYHACDSSLCPLSNEKKQEFCQEIDIQVSDPSGEIQYYILSSAPLVTLDGSPGIVGQFKNITSRKKAEEELAQANATLKRMAMVDGLTQVANRRFFDETLQREWRRMAREQQPFSLLICDIDFFKKYNDTYGHQEGDECLRQVAKALEESAMRPGDRVARYGGEEFGLILPGVNLDGAMVVANRILEAVRKLHIEHRTSTISPHVSISVGAACHVPGQEGSAEDLLVLADQALYQAKEQGRNRAVASALPEL